jgi:hypothetical protein
LAIVVFEFVFVEGVRGGSMRLFDWIVERFRRLVQSRCYKCHQKFPKDDLVTLGDGFLKMCHCCSWERGMELALEKAKKKKKDGGVQ